jgi:ribosomal-protein-alanine N-acetyltransferase
MSVLKVQVRRARTEDLGAVVALERETSGAPHWAEAEYAVMVDEPIDAFVRRLLVVAEGSDGELVGFAVGRMAGVGIDAFGELESVAVAVGARRAGVGRTLCEAVVEWCVQQGAHAVDLEVRSASKAAVALYRQLGFEAVGLRRSYYRDPVDDAILMSRVYSHS